VDTLWADYNPELRTIRSGDVPMASGTPSSHEDNRFSPARFVLTARAFGDCGTLPRDQGALGAIASSRWLPGGLARTGVALVVAPGAAAGDTVVPPRP